MSNVVSRSIRVCFWPGRESSYVRNRVLIQAMRENGIIVYDCSYHKKTVFRYLVGFFKFLKYKNKSDIIFIGFVGQFLVPIVRIFTRKKILFEAFLSTYQTLAFDRKSIRPKSIPAYFIRRIEKLSCQLSDLVLLDTEQHIQYFIKEYNLTRTKFSRLLLGADDVLMKPQDSKNHPGFLIHFHGEFQALHGTQYIIEAAHLLPDIQFRMIGGGREWPACKKQADDLNLKNLTFVPLLPFNKIPEHIAQADVCLGIFGDTEKTSLVVPFKVYECLAMKKAILTADTPAIREIFRNKDNIFLCETANPRSMAEAIRKLQDDKDLRLRIAENGYQLFKEQCSPKAIGQQLKTIIMRLTGLSP